MLQSLAESLAAVPVRPLVVVLAVLATGVVVRRLFGGRLTAALRRRLLLGVPWGTLLTIAGVLAVYLFVQGAYWHADLLVTPFRTWSYFYPLGLLTGAFTHGSVGHITGNLLGTLVYGTVVEYVWSHYPQSRGESSFGSLRTNPFARILAVPLVMAVVGVFTGVFALGPIVGFSGVVFALAGFALVTRPTLFLGAFLGSRIIDLVYTALRSPEPTVGGSVQFVTPWWANIAIQGHAIGLLAGVFLGMALLRARSERPGPERVFFATLVFATVQGLWAVYVPLGGGRFTLFRWLGTVLVLLLAILVAAATLYTDRRLLPDFEGGWPSLAGFALLVALAALCLASVPANGADIGAADLPEDGLEVRDYVVTYEEDVRNAYVDSMPLPPTAQQNITESGVVVASADREIWTIAVSRSRLALQGDATVLVGGVGWREAVSVDRRSWSVPGNDSVYSVALAREGGEARTVYTSGPSTLDGRVAGRNLTLRPVGSGFEIAVTRNGETVDRGPVPANTSSRDIGGLTFERNRSRLYAAGNGTRVIVARSGS
ncbi:rhomboid family intramembrane serine protease [Haloarcula onubensis]|uniref:Rhomboid family intramembrane serine protease n=1 Tax=Haloarcula onubensis TaxID=2950539 RepID=A0ABU2FMW0_9EURY|nr:rhomboid family intramembrane serine protease [Halomicroarcula sp. S3CR25-11]MDS0281749.1 rhomboid family intramembrane serine protease [Halomicroarcula sp. S3CR25-11]